MKSFDIVSKLKKVPSHVWVLIFLMTLGLFLRSYNLHDWLHFGKDQARDAMLTQAVARGEASWPLLGATMGNTPFAIGPMYYYFQIISAKIFGQDPAALAYPDILFSILSIPLLFLFLKKYFDRQISLILVGIYTVSYFSIIYARFAWNTNPIPFFVILFMLSLYEFLITRERVGWKWVIGVGVAVGVGVQLHAILMVLLPVMTAIVSIFLLARNLRIWKKIAVVFLLAIFLNGPQIFYEFRNNFANTKIFLESSFDKSSPDEGEFLKNLQLNTACHAQANMHILSSLGDRYNCNFISILTNVKKKANHNISLGIIFASFLFSIIAYAMLIFRLKKDKNLNKKYFLGLVLLFAALYFPLLMPAIDGASHRYFISVIFVPYVLLGLVLQFLKGKKMMIAKATFFVIPILLVLANMSTVFDEKKQLQEKMRGDSGFVVLDQLEDMKKFILENSDSKTIYLFGGANYLPIYALATQYVFLDKGINVVRGNDFSDAGDFPIFYVWKAGVAREKDSISGYKIQKSRDFGQLGLYKLQN